jgi:hypothetical protein
VNTQTAQVDDLQLIALPSAVNCGELFVRFTLTEWKLGPLVNEAASIARELVNAAVRANDPASPRLIALRLRLRGESLVVELQHDASAGTPAMPAALALLRTGITPLGAHGTLVWCELPLPTGLLSSAVPLPRRGQRRSVAAEQLAVQDTATSHGQQEEVNSDVLERILFGLRRPADDSVDQ